MYCTPFQRRKDYGTTVTHYLFVLESLQTDKEYYFIANVQQDNARYTEVLVSTDSDQSLNGKILATESGQYSYIVYGQTNATNLSPKGSVIVGELERGLMTLTGENSWVTPTLAIPDNVVYYE